MAPFTEWMPVIYWIYPLFSGDCLPTCLPVSLFLYLSLSPYLSCFCWPLMHFCIWILPALLIHIILSSGDSTNRWTWDSMGKWMFILYVELKMQQSIKHKARNPTYSGIPPNFHVWILGPKKSLGGKNTNLVSWRYHTLRHFYLWSKEQNRIGRRRQSPHI